MCYAAMVHARIDRLVFGADDPKAGAVGSLFDVVRDRRLRTSARWALHNDTIRLRIPHDLDGDALTIHAVVSASGGDGSIVLIGDTLLVTDPGADADPEIVVEAGGTITANVAGTTMLGTNVQLATADQAITLNTDDLVIDDVVVARPDTPAVWAAAQCFGHAGNG